ncbi:similar to Saccharomyces cerevisiae YLR417W VPS36 Component of the ESCRT-II complex [Maudiozyma barnettii]|uniref:Vacuolar protein-sorting-associated protein 36 n=1 Tax=Maudiozyma barnettii TaxID=61262 RepID=A0A8H2VIW1_9SACH|nr:ESCRT-II subunit protein VPS36 [Kazachstania barnettii]CAB4256185.1 similar to Saccharomyces cerevisiae YLR417W VPS36 Component of the ESCRT-II complex [Kazachstania barnettii]CAD1784793.1 similar to Saccharomyces cerevisiae YLR417W VPS36 Component of the ESCRT-II complex [Kazachstania barnettii]
MECWHHLEITASGRPILRENEKDIFIDYSVGLYDGKHRVTDKQNGRVFLTSQRVIYVGDQQPVDNSVFLELDNIKSIDYSSSFLKRSARIIIFLKESSTLIVDSDQKENTDKDIKSSWKCPICAYVNETKGEITEGTHNSLICTNCGIPAEFTNIVDSLAIRSVKKESKSNECPSCTFINHPRLTNCELCGTRLVHSQVNLAKLKQRNHRQHRVSGVSKNEYVQLSFRKSDGTLFAQSLEAMLDKLRKSDIFNKDAVCVNGVAVNDDEIKKFQESFNSNDNLEILKDKFNSVGISGLERSRENQLANNDILFNSALSDMNKLISLAHNIERLYKGSNIEDTSSTNTQHPSLIIDRDKFLNKDLFLDEISRDIYEYAIAESRDNETNNIMITLVDLYAMYNKAMRIGTGFISPEEMREACERFEKLGLQDLKLMKINSRILCVCSQNSLNYVAAQIVNLVTQEPGSDILKINQRLTSNNDGKSNWTTGVLTEILQYSVNDGSLVIDEQLTGIYYYKNKYW